MGNKQTWGYWRSEAEAPLCLILLCLLSPFELLLKTSTSIYIMALNVTLQTVTVSLKPLFFNPCAFFRNHFLLATRLQSLYLCCPDCCPSRNISLPKSSSDLSEWSWILTNVLIDWFFGLFMQPNEYISVSNNDGSFCAHTKIHRRTLTRVWLSITAAVLYINSADYNFVELITVVFQICLLFPWCSMFRRGLTVALATWCIDETLTESQLTVNLTNY